MSGDQAATGDQPGKDVAGDQQQKRVTWAELFFDLVFVIAIIQVSVLLGRDHSWPGLGRGFVVFVLVYSSWVGATQYGNLRVITAPPETLAIFVLGAAGLLMAVAVPGAFDRHGVVFGGAYLFLQIVLAVLLIRAQRRRRIRFRMGGLITVLTGPILLIGGITDGGLRTILWSVAAAVTLFLPWLLRRELQGTWQDPVHLSERFALLLIIALGETMVEIGFAASREPPTPQRLVAIVAGYALACSLWWLYFVFAIRGVRLAVAKARVQEEIIRPVLLYGHLLFIWGVIGVAVGLAEAVAAPDEHSNLQSIIPLVGGCALYLATFGYARWRTFRTVSWYRLGAALACLVFLPFGTLLPGLGVVLVLAMITISLNIIEELTVRRHGLSHLWRFGPGVPGAPESNVPEAHLPSSTEADIGAGTETDRGRHGPAVGG